MSLLKIYKASAGSGKTFSLAQEFLKHIFNPQTPFSSILAVTFTNKATAEMRDRILKELNILAQGKKSDHASVIKSEYGFSDTQLQQQAEVLLKHVLHNYSRFNVSTIDSFFQKILRSFAREIGLGNGFNIELDLNSAIEQSVSELIDDAKGDKKIREWLSSFAIKKIEEGKNWDIEKDVFEFCSKAFSEEFLSLPEERFKELSDINYFKNLQKELYHLVQQTNKELRALGVEAMELIAKYNLSVDDFSYKKTGIAGFFNKLQQFDVANINDFDIGPRIISASENPDGKAKWYSAKSEKGETVESCVTGGLHDILIKIIDYYKMRLPDVIVASSVLKTLDGFALVTEVFNNITKTSKDNNVFLLAFASPLLSKMIGNDDAPFFYEKTGNYLRHFMIDEFQDTSSLQWNNFSPLFNNGISQGYQSLVVGDVKQSIYRWRNGDWTLLQHKLEDRFKDFGVENVPMEINWRSAPEVINFNNEVFSKIAKMASSIQEHGGDEQEPAEVNVYFAKLIDNIFSNAHQNVAEKNIHNKGYVKVEFHEKLEESAEDEKQWYLDKTIESLIELFSKGYQPKDIAILVRNKKEGSLIAKHMMEYMRTNPKMEKKLAFVSNDSVLLESSSFVNLVVALLKYIANPDDLESKAIALFNYLLFNTNANSAATYLSDIDLKDNMQVLSVFPDNFSLHFEDYTKLPVSVLVDRVLDIFMNEVGNEHIKKQLPFIHSFQDMVLNYVTNNGNNITGFIEKWDDTGHSVPVNLPEGQNAIRIITIHKSKGLEYKAVLIPFTNWELNSKDSLLWCNLPFKGHKNEVMPIEYSSALGKSSLREEYLTEKNMALIDNINLLYVALTRAEQVLYIFAPKKKETKQKKKSEFSKISDVLLEVLRQSDKWDESNKLFISGELLQTKQEQKDELFEEGKDFSLVTKTDKREIKIRQTASEIYNNDNRKFQRKAVKGNIYHKIMESIIEPADIPKAVGNMLFDGVLTEDEAKEIESTLQHLLIKEPYAKWFDRSGRILTENSYISTGGEIKRPDRVVVFDNYVDVIDYKFTSVQKESHIKQVSRYVDDIKGISGKTVNGYVWYLPEDILVKISTPK